MTSIGGLPLRTRIREEDNATGSYPTISRTGDSSRTGAFNVFYDDLNTVIYNNSLKTGSITRTGVYGENITPFVESDHAEQGIETSFYLTGTSVLDSNIGFQEKLSSKTKVKINLDVSSLYTMNASTASIVYYNKSNKTFEVAGGADAYTAPDSILPWFNLGRDARLFGPMGLPLISGSIPVAGSELESLAWLPDFIFDIQPFFDIRYYDPLYTIHHPGIGAAIEISSLTPQDYTTPPPSTPRAMNYLQTGTVTLNPNFAATEDQLISMDDYISAPFLLEAIHIEMPISSSDGWFDDFTRTSMCKASLDLFHRFTDIGGPCVTVALLNQLEDRRREIILSATIIPTGDTGSFGWTINNIPTPSAGNNSLRPAGFGSFGSPHDYAVPSTGFHTVKFTTKPTVASGMLLYQSGNFSSSYEDLRNADFRKSLLYTDKVQLSEIVPYGRSLDPTRTSARSFFGKEYSTRDFVKNGPNLSYDPSIAPADDSLDTHHAGVIMNTVKHEVSPYLLLPKDKIIFSVSKYRPLKATVEPGGDDLHFKKFVYDFPVNTTGVLEHEFGLNTGQISMTLYGSLLREESAYHDTLNSNLSSNAVHEYIHDDNPVLDQYDIHTRLEFSGTYIDDWMTGTLASNVFQEDLQALQIFGGLRKRRLSLVQRFFDNDRNLTGSNNADFDFQTEAKDAVNNLIFTSTFAGLKQPGFFRNVPIISEEERYYDTLLPNAVELLNFNGATLYPREIPEFSNFPVVIGFYFIGQDTDNYQSDQAILPLGIFPDTSWDYIFPFESKYSNFNRSTDPFFLESPLTATSLVFFDNTVKTTISIARFSNYLNAGIEEDYKDYTQGGEGGFIYFYKRRGLDNFPLGDIVAEEYSKNDIALALYGRGDGMFGEAKIRADIFSDNSISATNYYKRVEPVICRGFKYGIYNAIKEKSKCIFRRDHYGHVRDMLEQRKYCKFYNDANGEVSESPIGIRFVNENDEQIDGLQTFSSNLSLEATSSLPYFDGEVKNRGDLPSTSLL